MPSRLMEIRTYLPEARLSNDDLQTLFPDLKVRELTRLTGVLSRPIAAPGETASDMAFQAAEKLFTETMHQKSSIDFIIFCSAGGDYITPATACVLQDRLGLSQQCGAFDFNQGCTGYIYGLNLADSLIQSGSAKNVLLLTAENMTRSLHPGDKANRAIFGDAATATLIGEDRKGKGLGKFVFGTDGSRYDQIIIKNGGERFPLPEFAAEDFFDEYGNVRNDSCFFMNGTEVFNFSVEKAPSLVRQLLESAGLELSEIDLFVFHQANRIILETIARKLGIPEDKMVIDLAETGNTVSSTIPIALEKQITAGNCLPGMKVMLAGFGVGFSWGGTLLSF